MIALIVVALGAVAAIVGTSVLVARSTRAPHVYLIAWAIALFGLAVGLAAATVGLIVGFGAVTFRAMELGTGLLAPLGFCFALVELTGTRLASRFAMRLATSGLFVIAIAIMGTDPINPNVTFSDSWPDPATFYQLAPVALLGFLAVFTSVTAVAAFAVVTRRSSRERLPRADARPATLLAIAAFVIVLPGLVRLLHSGAGISLPLGDDVLFALTSLATAVLAWYAAKVAGERNLGQAGAAADKDDDRRYGRRSYRDYETGEFDEYGRGHGPGPGEYDDPYGSRRSSADLPRIDRADSDIRYPALAALAADPAQQPGLYREQDRRDELDRYDDEHRRYEDGYADGGPYTGFEERERYDERYDEPGGHGDSRQPGGEPRGEMFGQITIYTLIEGRVEEFDRLTERVVALVQAKEPDTIVYIVHAVPTAPMQRILYEVYRDRAAHDEHLHRGYVLTYEADQRPLVLATNVIELGLQQAKVSPLPTPAAISDILSESGIDLTGITRSAQPGFSRPDDYRRDDRQDEKYQREDYQREDYQREDYQREDYRREDYRREGHRREGHRREDRPRDDYPRDDHARQDYPREPGPPGRRPGPGSGYDQPYQGRAGTRGEDGRYR